MNALFLEVLTEPDLICMNVQQSVCACVQYVSLRAGDKGSSHSWQEA